MLPVLISNYHANHVETKRTKKSEPVKRNRTNATEIFPTPNICPHSKTGNSRRRRDEIMPHSFARPVGMPGPDGVLDDGDEVDYGRIGVRFVR
jgi:hypothetical protein